MIINSITLKNFKSYEEETTLYLKPEQGKNIILIGGENGAGKSTLFQAIKLCIYGATAFGYVGQNYYYTELVKSYINNNAFSQDTIDTFIELDISFDSSHNEDHYTLRRCWTYENEKIVESFWVYHNNTLLENEELDFFDQLLKSTLPPSLFSFFFFDGEELGDFFTDKSSKQNMRESILELFNFNTFDILGKHLKSYQKAQAKNDIHLKETQEEYENISAELENLKDKKAHLESQIENWLIDLDNLYAEEKKLNENFKNSGGLLEEDRIELNNTLSRLENERTEITLSIRNFSNNKLPFLLVSRHLEKLLVQVKEEQQLMEYQLFKDKLDAATISTSLFECKNIQLSNTDSQKVADTLLANLFDIKQLNRITEILGLSKEQSQSIISLCNTILNNKKKYSEKLDSHYNRLQEINTALKEVKSKINTAVNEEQLYSYVNTIKEINQKCANIKAQIETTNGQLALLDQAISSTTLAHTKAKNKTIELLQESNISNLSIDLINYFDELLKNMTYKKIESIQQEFLNIFKQIIRKDNFIDDIKLDENFNSTLYILKEYTTSELINICNNLGFKNLSLKYGQLFVDDLCKYFNATESTILDALWRSPLDLTLKVHTKINVALLSSGEKQVYVLCLIWAILKVSGVDIPFIIDTPYARIDTTHRNALTTLYLPNISKQVIILSTNEEIDHELYQTISPYIAKEQLLVYDNVGRKTIVKNSYFEV